MFDEAQDQTQEDIGDGACPGDDQPPASSSLPSAMTSPHGQMDGQRYDGDGTAGNGGRIYEQRNKQKREAGPQKDKQKSPEEVEKEKQKRERDEEEAKRNEEELLAQEAAVAAAAAAKKPGKRGGKKHRPKRPNARHSRRRCRRPRP
ncbi:unnamed protein product [Vitrella brassicaformis CCMP3155]|uniref:Uncharacterized protein n=1 Tax=Vitrella brassicaformis (strain CCMP3155) TaxID=1169540 RepID=A0A0G4GMR6_VITBC|nr:unnamed protein product [Vitrella brassicaformis CCMP3155]|eukprot:CEM31491.1 unnamed protein product [Vitrella brassicaformis CCMP3155]